MICLYHGMVCAAQPCNCTASALENLVVSQRLPTGLCGQPLLVRFIPTCRIMHSRASTQPSLYIQGWTRQTFYGPLLGHRYSSINRGDTTPQRTLHAGDTCLPAAAAANTTGIAAAMLHANCSSSATAPIDHQEPAAAPEHAACHCCQQHT